MVTKVSIFGNIKLAKSNPWANMRGKFGAIVREGLAKPKKPEYILASPPPWYFDKNALSPAQKQVIETFREVARRTAGLPLRDRIIAIKEALGGRKFAVVRSPVQAPATARKSGVTQ
jgi:hypothetical protein